MGKKKTLRCKQKKQKKRNKKGRYTISTRMTVGDYAVNFNKEELLYNLNTTLTKASDMLIDRVLELSDFYEKMLDKYISLLVQENNIYFTYNKSDLNICEIDYSLYEKFYVEPIKDILNDLDGDYLNTLYKLSDDKLPKVKQIIFFVEHETEDAPDENITCVSAEKSKMRLLSFMSTYTENESRIFKYRRLIHDLVQDFTSSAAQALALRAEEDILDSLKVPEFLLNEGKYLDFTRDVSYYENLDELILVTTTTCGLPKKYISNLLYDRLLVRNMEIIDMCVTTFSDKLEDLKQFMYDSVKSKLNLPVLRAIEIGEGDSARLEFIEQEVTDVEPLVACELDKLDDTDADSNLKYVGSYRELSALATKNGFIYDRAKGDHGIFRNEEGVTIVIPQGRSIGKGLSLMLQKTILNLDKGGKNQWIRN